LKEGWAGYYDSLEQGKAIIVKIRIGISIEAWSLVGERETKNKAMSRAGLT
jgi:hypothetical protein